MTESRRKEFAREDIEIGMDDPYWLTNLHGEINEEDIERMAQELREDAETMQKAVNKIKSGEWIPSEAALYIANNAHFGDYDAKSTVEEIQKEVKSEM